MSIVPTVADMAHFNPVNFTEIKAAGIVGVIHKARQGLGYGDPKYAGRMAAAKAAGLMWGAYDFATHDDPVANVKEFLRFANLGSGDVACLDFEDNTASQMTAEQARIFLTEGAQILGRPLAIYGGNRIREQIDHQDARWIELAKTVRLWQCRYIKAQPADNAELFQVIKPIPPWTENFLIQFTGDGTGPKPHTVQGLENGADLNAFDGTPEQLIAAWSGVAVAAPSAPSIVQRAEDAIKSII